MWPLAASGDLRSNKGGRRRRGRSRPRRPWCVRVKLGLRCPPLSPLPPPPSHSPLLLVRASISARALSRGRAGGRAKRLPPSLNGARVPFSKRGIYAAAVARPPCSPPLFDAPRVPPPFFRASHAIKKSDNGTSQGGRLRDPRSRAHIVSTHTGGRNDLNMNWISCSLNISRTL